MKHQISTAIYLFKKHHGILRTSEALHLGIHPRVLLQMKDNGLIEQMSRGLYKLTNNKEFAEPDLILVSKKIPQGVICLVSALAYYEITSQIPHFAYIAIPNKSKKSSLDYPPIRYFWYSDKFHAPGIETHLINNIPIKIYNIEKTLVGLY